MADAIAAAARRNAADDTYESPYTVEALRQGMDLSWWEKLKGVRFAPKGGGFKLGKLQVRLLWSCRGEKAHQSVNAAPPVIRLSDTHRECNNFSIERRTLVPACHL